MDFTLTTKKVLKKLGGDKISGKNYLIPQTNFFAEDDGEGLYVAELGTSLAFTLVEIQLAGGEIPDKVTCLFDGNPYVLDIVIIEENGVKGYALGNLKYYGEEDTGEPFLLISGNNDGIVCETAGEHTFAIYYEKETIVPIDQKYLPEGYGGGGLPVVALRTEFSTEYTELTAEESAKMEAAASTGLPCVIQFFFSGLVQSAVFNLQLSEGDYSYGYMVGQIGCIVQRVSATTWESIVIQE